MSSRIRSRAWTLRWPSPWNGERARSVRMAARRIRQCGRRPAAPRQPRSGRRKSPPRERRAATPRSRPTPTTIPTRTDHCRLRPVRSCCGSCPARTSTAARRINARRARRGAVAGGHGQGGHQLRILRVSRTRVLRVMRTVRVRCTFATWNAECVGWHVCKGGEPFCRPSSRSRNRLLASRIKRLAAQQPATPRLPGPACLRSSRTGNHSPRHYELPRPAASPQRLTACSFKPSSIPASARACHRTSPSDSPRSSRNTTSRFRRRPSAPTQLPALAIPAGLNPA